MSIRAVGKCGPRIIQACGLRRVSATCEKDCGGFCNDAQPASVILRTNGISDCGPGCCYPQATACGNCHSQGGGSAVATLESDVSWGFAEFTLEHILNYTCEGAGVTVIDACRYQAAIGTAVVTLFDDTGPCIDFVATDTAPIIATVDVGKYSGVGGVIHYYVDCAIIVLFVNPCGLSHKLTYGYFLGQKTFDTPKPCSGQIANVTNLLLSGSATGCWTWSAIPFGGTHFTVCHPPDDFGISFVGGVNGNVIVRT